MPSGTAWAQADTPGEPDVSKANVRFGRLLLKPTISLTNLGFDTNVFNEHDNARPKRDFTLTVTPQTDLWLRMGRSWLIGNVKENLVWYKTYDSERSANDSAKVGWLLPWNRLTFDADASFLSTRDRPGFEIDARSQRGELAFHGGTEMRLSAKTYVGFRGERRRVRFDSVATFDGVALREALNRTESREALTLRYQLTPLTGLTLDLGRARDRFQFTPLRDSDSTNVTVGIKLDPFALIKGTATVGYRSFQPLSSDLPAFNGVTASTDLSYVAFGRTRLGVQAIRDLQYSFQLDRPYYLLSGTSASVAHQLSGRFDVGGRLSLQRLTYRDRLSAVLAVPQRIDHVRIYGGTVGYRLGNEVRVGLNLDRQHRRSPVFDREYHGFKFGTSVTYGL